MANLFNEDVIKGKWHELKGELQKTWGRLTDDELNQTQGDLTSIGGLIQQKYGIAKEEIRNKLDELIAAFRRDDHGVNADEVAEAKRETSSELKDQYRQF